MGKTLRIAAIPGDGIGKEVMPEGLRVLEAAATRFGIELQFKHIEWASCDYYAKTGQMMPDDWKAQLDGMDAVYFGAVGWPATVPDHVSLWGIVAEVPARVRPVHQPAPGAPVRRRAVPAGRAQGRRHRLLRRAREHRRRIHQPGWRHVRRHRARGRGAGVGVQPLRRRPGAEVRLRAGAIAAAQASDGGDQEQRHRDQHALVGQTCRRRAPRLSAGDGGQAAHRHPVARASCCSPRASTSWWRATCSATSCPTWARPAPAPSAWRLRPTSTPSASFLRCSSPCMDRHPTSTARTSPTRWR